VHGESEADTGQEAARRRQEEEESDQEVEAAEQQHAVRLRKSAVTTGFLCAGQSRSDPSVAGIRCREKASDLRRRGDDIDARRCRQQQSCARRFPRRSGCGIARSRCVTGLFVLARIEFGRDQAYHAAVSIPPDGTGVGKDGASEDHACVATESGHLQRARGVRKRVSVSFSPSIRASASSCRRPARRCD
jgi:hypothetical protein